MWQPFASVSNAVIGVPFMSEGTPPVYNLKPLKEFGCLASVRIPESCSVLVSAAGVCKAERLIIARMPSPRLADLEARPTSLNSADK